MKQIYEEDETDSENQSKDKFVIIKPQTRDEDNESEQDLHQFQAEPVTENGEPLPKFSKNIMKTLSKRTSKLMGYIDHTNFIKSIVKSNSNR